MAKNKNRKKQQNEKKKQEPKSTETNTLLPAFILAVFAAIFCLSIQYGHIDSFLLENYQTFSKGFISNILASISVLHSRLTMHYPGESFYFRFPIALALAAAAFRWDSIGIVPLFAIQVTSYFPLSSLSSTTSAAALCALVVISSNFNVFIQLFQLLFTPLSQPLEYLLPISEFSEAYRVVYSFIGDDLYAPLLHLTYITVNIQITLGYVGIAYLISYQKRSIQLINNVAGKGTPAARLHFWRVAWFILTVSVPYLLHRTCMEIANDYAFLRFSNQIKFSARHSPMLALAEAPHGPGDYAGSISVVVTTTYRTIDRKLFSVPKLALLPPLIWAHPVAMGAIFPLAVAADWGRSLMLSALTTRITETNRIVDELASKRRQIEEFDRKNVEKMERSGGEVFAQDRREILTHEIHTLQVQGAVLKNGRSFIKWLYWKDLLLPTLEIGTAALLALDKIGISEITVYSRVIEDAIDALLMRSRNEAQFVEMQREMDKLKFLKSLIDDVDKTFLECTIGEEFRIQNLKYSRNKVNAHFSQTALPPTGMYAITGANGSGKSTFLRVLMSCKSNQRRIELHSSIEANVDALRLPSSDVQEVLQNIYWPLHMAPADWFILNDNFNPEIVVSLLEDLKFYQDEDHDLLKEITDEKKDWFSELSGGQKIKAELVRKIFLPEKCSKVLLLDEILAPLDPLSKSLVMRKIKDVCKSSLVLLIHHTDAGSKCVASQDFFEGNIHIENGKGELRELCE